jgi:small-conductance mechanosensitive channel
LVDQTPWQTAVALTALAATQEEMAYARQAEHLADHEVDQAFATALRSASLQQRTLTGPALELKQQVASLEAEVSADQAAVKAATPAGGDDLDLAQAQLQLDQDELTDAKGDLARASGDNRGDLQQELQARQADVKKFDASNGSGEVAVVAVSQYRTLAGMIGAWRRQSSRAVSLDQAAKAALQAAAQLQTEHNKLEASPDATKTNQAASTADRLDALKRRSLERQLMSIYDDRIATEQQLAAVYTKWSTQVALQHRIVAHLLLVQTIWVVVLLLAAILLNALVKHFTERESLDARRMRTLSRIGRLLIQVLTLIGILLITFGPPEHLSTVIGLVTAGLTVALQDFILAFVGWFILMGRNGIGVGDIVEINAVAGEVVEIGLFRTTLLETGNWTAKGHPTGRRVAFNNKFSISGQYFNFSTAGQWMWDELTITIPQGEDTNAAIERVHKIVEDETADDARLAEAEWQKGAGARGLGQFSATPDVNLRPNGAGLDLVVRYVTRASGRFERRNKLYQCVLQTVQSRN